MKLQENYASKFNTMFKVKALTTLIFLLSYATYAQYTDIINSNRPGKSQSAFAVGKNVFQLETGVYGIYENHEIYVRETFGVGSDLNLRYGTLLEQLEFNADLQYQYDQHETILGSEIRSNFKQIIIGAKYLVYDPYKYYKGKGNIKSWKTNQKFNWRDLIPAVSAYAGANLNFDSPYTFKTDPKISPRLTLITQNQFPGNFVLIANIIADKIGTDFPSYGYIITVTKSFNKRWSAFLEDQGYNSDFYSDAIIRGGAAYLFNPNLQVDASVTSNLKNTPSIYYAGIGLSWRYDNNHEETWVKFKKKKKKSKKSKGKSGIIDLANPVPAGDAPAKQEEKKN